MSENRVRIVWENELDRLELDILRIERLVRGLVAAPDAPWSPPVVPGPIPADLLPRADDLLRRQEEARARLVVALDEAQKQATYADKVIQITGRRSTGPVYLDLEA